MDKRKLVKKTIYYDKEDYLKLTERCKSIGTTPSKRIRQLIARDNFKPLLEDFDTEMVNNTKTYKTTPRDTLKEE